MEDRAKDSFLVELWARIFKRLSRISLFVLVKSHVLARGTFRISHLRDPSGLARKLRDRSDPVSTFLSGYLEEEEHRFLRGSDLSRSPSRKLCRLVLKCLNAALEDDRLFSPERFSKLSVPTSLASSIAKPSYISRAKEINRELLELSYPDELERISSIAYRFVDSWVLGNLVASILSLLALYAFHGYSGHRAYSVLSTLLVCYGFYRIFEIVIYQADVLLFAHYRATRAGQPYLLRGYRRIVLALLHNYAEIVFWFGSAYVFFSYEMIGGYGVPLAEVLTGSLLQMLGEPSFGAAEGSTFLPLVVLLQTAVGLFMTTLSLARFIGLIPTPGSLDPFEVEQIRESLAKGAEETARSKSENEAA